MSVKYNLEPFDVLKIIYGSGTDGISEEEFERNKIERGIEVPQSIKLFLEKYAYKPVNHQGGITLFHPNIMTAHRFKDSDGTELSLVAVGRTGGCRMAVCEGNIADPAVFLIKAEQNSFEITLSQTTVFELIKENIFGVLSKMRSAVSVNDAKQAVELLHKYDVDLDEIENGALVSRNYMFNFNNEKRAFIIADFLEGKLSRFVFVSDENFSG